LLHKQRIMFTVAIVLLIGVEKNMRYDLAVLDTKLAALDTKLTGLVKKINATVVKNQAPNMNVAALQASATCVDVSGMTLQQRGCRFIRGQAACGLGYFIQNNNVRTCTWLTSQYSAPRCTASPQLAVQPACCPAEDLNPPESARTYSSVAGNDAPGTGHARSMLDSPQAWSTQWSNGIGEWMMIDLGASREVQGVIIMRRADNRGVTNYGTQRVTSVSVSVAATSDGPWTDAGEYDCPTTDSTDKSRVMLTQPVTGQFVKLSPTGYYWHTSMRAGLIATMLTC